MQQLHCNLFKPEVIRAVCHFVSLFNHRFKGWGGGGYWSEGEPWQIFWLQAADSSAWAAWVTCKAHPILSCPVQSPLISPLQTGLHSCVASVCKGACKEKTGRCLQQSENCTNWSLCLSTYTYKPGGGNYFRVGFIKCDSHKGTFMYNPIVSYFPLALFWWW